MNQKEIKKIAEYIQKTYSPIEYSVYQSFTRKYGEERAAEMFHPGKARLKFEEPSTIRYEYKKSLLPRFIDPNLGEEFRNCSSFINELKTKFKTVEIGKYN